MSDDAPGYENPTTIDTPPPAVLAWLDGTDLEEKVGTAVGIVTADADGWPRPAQLSAGEILLSSDGGVRLLLHGESGTAANLRRDGRMVMMLAADGANDELRFEVTEAAPLEDPPRATFVGRLVSAREHRVPYAEVTDGVRYRLHDPDAVLDRWRRQIEALRGLDA
ncbi:MAG: hypothetical protein QM729_03120 [Solirubrobacterales bacterium]